jgi:hypothetical protein
MGIGCRHRIGHAFPDFRELGGKLSMEDENNREVLALGNRVALGIDAKSTKVASAFHGASSLVRSNIHAEIKHLRLPCCMKTGHSCSL